MEVNVLGTKYTIMKKKYSEDPVFERRVADGYCDSMLKQIVYCDMTTYKDFEYEPEEYAKACEKQTLRHEIIHAFLSESGLAENSTHRTDAWAMNEEMVDWIAIQHPKLQKAFEEAGAL